jgi:hypothetical protein
LYQHEALRASTRSFDVTELEMTNVLTTVLEEVTEPSIDRAHVARRIDDWAERIDRLYAQLEQWLPPGWTADRSRNVRMHEPLMEKFDIAPRNLPVLTLLHQGEPAARVAPRGLWIVGINGRLDLYRGDKHFTIIDTAENLTPSAWHIAPYSNRHDSRPLNRETFAAAL